MSTIKVVSMTGAEVGSVEVNDAIFGIEPNMSVGFQNRTYGHGSFS